jgi:hypothetical protein
MEKWETNIGFIWWYEKEKKAKSMCIHHKHGSLGRENIVEKSYTMMMGKLAT